ncbi:MAG: Zn-ribbon domain-containing OB-fold protein [Acidobacteria bacterium]|nr:Zn-ribbon domain-containing OB-fold protein [Acidobacteriota bacterium]
MAGQPTNVRGTPVRSADLKKGRVFTTTYVPRIQYAWDTGQAIGRYLEELKNGRLIARRCNNCQRIMIPPRMFCERCFRPTHDWVVVKDTGTVNTFSLSYVSWDVRRLKKPEIPAVIEIDGASKGMGILHVLGNVSPKAVRIGMKVRAVWKPAQQRTGSITDIAYFEPIKGKHAATKKAAKARAKKSKSRKRR